jgi:hypothetical protein
MTAPLTTPISDELLAMPGKPYRHVQSSVWNARVQSGDLLGGSTMRVGGKFELFAIDAKISGQTRPVLQTNPANA